MAEKILHLQPRLRALADLVPDRARLADIGTDHGYIPVSLLQQGRIERAIAADIGAEPLEHARRTAAEYGLTEKISFRLCDGLAGIEEGECDCVLIAGMGGETIISILHDAAWLADGGHLLLLQPQSRQELLRSWLTEQGFTVMREHLVRDKGTLYNILQVRAGERPPLSETEIYGGVGLWDDPLYGEYLDWQIEKLEQPVKGLRLSNDEGAKQRIRELEARIELLKTRKGAWLDDRRS